MTDVDYTTPPSNGQVLIYNSTSSKWVPTTREPTVNTQTASYTLVLADASKYVRMNVASANTLTVPPNSSVAFPVGTTIPLRQAGAGQTTVTAGAGVTITSAETTKLRKQHASATLIKVATDSWDLTGDVELA